MIQIPDAPWIRDAERNGYPCGSDDAEEETDNGVYAILYPELYRDECEDFL